MTKKYEEMDGEEFVRKDSQNIFTPSIYHGLEDVDPRYRKRVRSMDWHEIIPLVKDRAEKDGQWCIDMGLVGGDEDKMRKMIAYVADEENIKKCVKYISAHERENDRTVDFVCRDIANGSRRGL